MRTPTVLLVMTLLAEPALSDSPSSCPNGSHAEAAKSLRVGTREFLFQANSIVDVTRTSSSCLGCHDGVVATDALPGVRTAFASARPGGAAEHPIDVPYPRMRKGFRAAFDLDPRLKLQDGMVTCHKCHRGTDDSPDRLSIPNTRSALCLGCHLK